MVIAQTPDPDNRISLSATRRDDFGQPLAQLEWSVRPQDVANLKKCVDGLEETWNSSDLKTIARFIRRPDSEAAADLAAGGGIYHPAGSTRMADAVTEGVVDHQLRVFGLPNLRVVSTSVLPTVGGANPTMMLLMLGLRCVDDLTRTMAGRC